MVWSAERIVPLEREYRLKRNTLQCFRFSAKWKQWSWSKYIFWFGSRPMFLNWLSLFGLRYEFRQTVSCRLALGSEYRRHGPTRVGQLPGVHPSFAPCSQFDCFAYERACHSKCLRNKDQRLGEQISAKRLDAERENWFFRFGSNDSAMYLAMNNSNKLFSAAHKLSHWTRWETWEKRESARRNRFNRLLSLVQMNFWKFSVRNAISAHLMCGGN